MRLTLRFLIALAGLLLATSFGFPALFHGPYPHVPGPVFDREVSKLYRYEIEAQQPDVVLLGDSILTKDVDAAIFQKQTGLSTYKLDIPGSSSALWYLIVKSNIVPAQYAPRSVVVLFRDTLLTSPAFRTTGPYFGLIDKFAGPKDTLLLERAYLSQLSPLQTALETYLPLYTYRGEVRESIDAGLRHGVPEWLGCDRDCADGAVQAALDNVRPEELAASIIQAEQVLYTPGQLDFPAQVEGSFLPEIIRLAQQRGIRLIFVRAPTRIFPNENEEPGGLKTYMADLKAYLEAKHIPLVDLAWASAVEDEYFSDPHHMTPQGKTVFTGILVDALQNHLK